MPRPTKYVTLMELLRGQIISGEFPLGERIPPENELAERYRLSRQTVRQALAVLERDGYIQKKRGSGSVAKSVYNTHQRSRDIAVITTYIGDYIFPTLLRGIEETLRLNDYSPVIMATANRLDNERSILTDILAHPPAGIIVEGTKTALPNPNLELYRTLYERSIPIVFVHSFYPELAPPVYVLADDRAGGYEAVRFLKELGHTQLAGIFKSDDMQGHHRYSGYLDALKAFSLPIRDDRLLWYTTESRSTLQTGQLLQLLDGCTALVCYNDEIAVQVLELLRGTARQVPENLALLGFDNSTYGNLTPVKITSLSCDVKGLGHLAAEKLLCMLRSEAQTPTVLPWAIIEKESTPSHCAAKE